MKTRTETHVLPVPGEPGSGLEIAAEWRDDLVGLTTRFGGKEYRAGPAERFDDALRDLLAKVLKKQSS